MNFYNPFKPHIVRDTDGTYMVRKLPLPFGTAAYLEQNNVNKYCAVPGFYWWYTDDYVLQCCKYNSLEMAVAVLNAYKEAAKTKRTITYVPIK